MADVAILWHMHQPYYEDLVTREHILPWARLHTLKDYFGMVTLLGEFPEVRVTFNLVPSLLVQIEAFAEGRAQDQYLELGLKPASELTEGDVAFIVKNFFHAQRTRMIDAYPRYAELLAKRGSDDVDRHPDVARRFSSDDLRDLQVWQKLAWIDPYYLDGDPRVRGLLDKGRNFSEDDKQTLREVELDLLNAAIPAYRDAAARGQVELSTSPFYHPILPLLCDTDVYKRTHPDAPRPRSRFQRPEDAMEQLNRASAYFERLFGRRPTGLWPSEGSVSNEMVPLVSRAGFNWMATDELILARTLNVGFSRGGDGQLEEPERLYQPYMVTAGGARVACLFRDHLLSDLIGFTYAGWGAGAAAEDFVSRLAAAGRRYRQRTGRDDAVIPVILDGENAWEHFEGGGRPFLRALYRRLSGHPELRTVTVTEACQRSPMTELPEIFPGSWIDANFSIWIGHDDDRRGWSQLADARDALDGATGDEATIARARDEVLIAEGSDWFWWYGDDHSSDQDLDFDELFRRHLRNVYRLLGRPVPDELFVSNITTGAAPPLEVEPTALITPTIDGEESSYFEWLGAGILEIRETAGAMHRVSGALGVAQLIRFGFDERCLYVRVDGPRPMRDVLADGVQVILTFLTPEHVRFGVTWRDGAPRGAFLRTPPDGSSPNGPNDRSAGDCAAGTVLEIAVPLVDLWSAGQAAARVAFFVSVIGPTGGELERHPP